MANAEWRIQAARRARWQFAICHSTFDIRHSAFILAVLIAGCQRDAPDPAKSALILIASGDTAGWIVPCGCASNQSGGMMRRGTYVEERRRDADVVLVDAGGAPGGESPYHRVKFEAILRGEIAMGLAAHNLGGPELRLGPDYLRDVMARLRVPFISANARTADGAPIAAAMRIVEAAGRRTALVGVVSPRYETDDVRVAAPREAVLAAAGDGGFDSLVVLAYLPEEELRELAAALPEADVVLGGPTGQAIPPQRIGPVLLASSTNKGKFLVELSGPSDRVERQWAGSIVEMGERFADAAAQQANLKEYLATLAARDFEAGETGFIRGLPPASPDFQLAGSESCRACHTGDCATWEGSRHAHAWETLRTRGYHVDSYCQQCHTDGFGLPGGFVSVSKSPARVNVGCETCHGPSAAHVREPSVRTPFAAADQCIRCHDQENSPLFDYNAYWPRIVHGQEAEK